MRNTLQYLYSIGVFLGVLVSSYFMIQRTGGNRLPIAFQLPNNEPVFTKEAGIGNPAFDQLFAIEKALSKHGEEKNRDNDEKKPASIDEDEFEALFK